MINISNLKVGYEGKVVAEISSLKITRGEHCLILGESGSGKTTLLYAIAGLLSPISGEIKINETNICNLSNQEKDKFRGNNIGIIFQTLHMVNALNVIDNTIFPQYSAGIKQNKQSASEILSTLGLADHLYKKPYELSQGQQQRVAIARAAINSPAIILGDEPTSALDDKSCEAVIKLLLSTAAATNSSLIIATHDSRIKKHFTKTITLGGKNE
jgi:ABC-type lipoprotein export system ATPase subunit